MVKVHLPLQHKPVDWLRTPSSFPVSFAFAVTTHVNEYDRIDEAPLNGRI